MRSLRRRAIASASLALSLALPSTAAAEAGDGLPDLAASTGYGTAYGTADLVYVELGIDYRRATLAASLRENDAAVARIRRVLRARGVAARDILATGLYMSRFYHQVHGEFVPRYQTNRALSLVLRDVDHAEQILDAAETAGGDRVAQFNFTLGVTESHLGALTTAARTLALADAKAQAATKARQVGRPLGAVHVIAEDLNRPYDTRRMRSVTSTSGGPALYVQAPSDVERRGRQVGIEIQTTAVWDLGPGPGPDTPRTVSVVGVGAAWGPAQDVVAEIVVERTLKNASAARREVAARARRIRESLAASGIRARDVRTTFSGVLPSQKSFQARQVLEVTLRDVDAAEPTIVAAVTAGGPDTGVGVVRYTVADRGELVRIAKDAAVADALTMTEQYARLAGLVLGKAERWGPGHTSDRPYEGAAGVAAGPQPIRRGPGAGQVQVLAPLTRALGRDVHDQQ